MPLFPAIRRTYRFITRHPFAGRHKLRAFTQLFRWQLLSRLWGQPLVTGFAENARLLVRQGMTGATGNIYAGLHEFHDMAFVLHLLRAGDYMVDVGANIGSYTILAAKVKNATVTAFEPVPTTFHWLQLNILLNEVSHLVTARNAGCADKPGTLRFSKNQDTTNHVLAAGEEVEFVEVETVPLDLAIDHSPVMLKIDAEGFETPVLNGGKALLKNPALKAIIIELNGSGGRYGFRDEDIHRNLLEVGFRPFQYDAFTRQLTELPTYGRHNTIYVRDPEWVAERTAASEPFVLWGESI